MSECDEEEEEEIVHPARRGGRSRKARPKLSFSSDEEESDNELFDVEGGDDSAGTQFPSKY